MCIVTPYDGNTPSMWTRAGPSAAVLRRALVLADSALNYILRELGDNMNDNVLVSKREHILRLQMIDENVRSVC